MKRIICIAAAITIAFVIAIFAGSGEDTKGTVKSIRNPQLEISPTAVPGEINYQGALFDKATGEPVSEGEMKNMAFKIYDSQSYGTLKWAESHASVTVGDNGLVNVLLGTGSSISGLPHPELKDIFDGSTRWLEVVVGTEVLSPRLSMASVPYAFKSDDTGGGTDGDWTIVGNDMYSAVSGNVGIGTDDPKEKLDVAGNIAIGWACSLMVRQSWPTGNSCILRNGWDGVRGDFVEFFVPGQGPSNEGAKITIKENGKVGIGTTNPGYKLDVDGIIAATGTDGFFRSKRDDDGTRKYALAITRGSMGVAGISTEGTTGGPYDLAFEVPTDSKRLVIANNGNVGIGTTNPETKLDVSDMVRVQGHKWPSSGVGMELAYHPDKHKGYIQVYDRNMNTWGDLFLGYGIVSVGVLEITGGCDIAEPFDIVEPDEIEPGMVVVIDPENPEKLKISDRAYDRCVAGIVSGAGGIKPGMTLTQEDSFEGNHQIALTGRVYGLCDASYGSIEPGDLLTTSTTPGYAMKVTDYEQAQGAILGKAMTSLEDGQGLALILVSLQ